jgi:glycosyltransferase involved in cell wall biosynthesis
LRILLCSHHYPPSIGGVERQSALLAEGLVRRGHEVRVLTAGARGRERVGGVEIERLGEGGPGAAGVALFAARLDAAVVARARWAQLLHVQQALPPAATLAVVARALRKPLVVTNHGSGASGAMAVMARLPLGGLGLRALRLAACVALTQEMAAEMRAQGIEPKAIIPNGVELPARVVEERDGVAVFAGRLDREKDLPLLQRAAGLLRHGAIDVLGDGPERPSLGPPLRLHGRQADVSPWLSRARVFVLPSKSEGMSMALLEAMAHGCACVATDVGGNRALLEDGAGSLVPAGDAAALAREVDRLLVDADAARALGAAARARIASSYSAEKMTEAYERLYESL